MSFSDDTPAPGEIVVLTRLPAALVDGLSEEEQNALVAIVAKQVRLVAYADDGRAELQFDGPFDGQTDGSPNTHSIWVDPKLIERHRGPNSS